jgi:hypothetical protein
MMTTIRYQAEMLKSHSDYPVTNTQWEIIDANLREYLDTLKLSDFIYDCYNDLHRSLFDDVNQPYLRIRFRNVKNEEALLRMDPWHRVFKSFPPFKLESDLYKYYCFRNNVIKVDVNVIVTTVNNGRVYCVDIVKDV